MSIVGVCLALVALGAGEAPGGAAPIASAAAVFIPTERFTLAWTHSIEKVRWEEDYAVVAGERPGSAPVLRALVARIRGSAAGMEPPPDARLRDGWFEYTPMMPTPPELRLTRSEFTPDYEWCRADRCRPLSDWLPSDGGVTRLTACTGPA